MTERLEERIRGALAASAEVEPSPAMDRAVRMMLLAGRAVRRPLARPEMAAGLAAAGLLALLAGLATVFAQAGAAERGPVVALTLLFVYLAASSAAALPILFHQRRRQAAGAGGFDR